MSGNLTFEDMKANRRPHFVTGQRFSATDIAPFSQIYDENGTMERSDVIKNLEANLRISESFDELLVHLETQRPDIGIKNFAGAIFDGLLRSCSDSAKNIQDLQSEFLYIINAYLTNEEELQKFVKEIIPREKRIIDGEIGEQLSQMTEEDISRFGGREAASSALLHNKIIAHNKQQSDAQGQLLSKQKANEEAEKARRKFEATMIKQQKAAAEQRGKDAIAAQLEIKSQEELSEIYQQIFQRHKNLDIAIDTMAEAKTLLPTLESKFSEISSIYPSYFGFGSIQNISMLLQKMETLLSLSLLNVGEAPTTFDDETEIIAAFVQLKCAIDAAHEFLTDNAKVKEYSGRLYRPISPNLNDASNDVDKQINQLTESQQKIESIQKKIKNAQGLEYFSVNRFLLEKELGRSLILGELNKLVEETIQKTTIPLLRADDIIIKLLAKLQHKSDADTQDVPIDFHYRLISDVFRRPYKNMLTEKDKENIQIFTQQLSQMKLSGGRRRTKKHAKKNHARTHNKKTHKRRANKKRRKTHKKRRYLSSR